MFFYISTLVYSPCYWQIRYVILTYWYRYYKMWGQKGLLIYFVITCIALGANIIALFYQFYFHELPCPLCLLQRVGLFFIAYASFINLKFGKRFKYDFIIIISSLYSLSVTTRQVLLHIMPNDPGYGSKFLSFHFYTWNDIISFFFILLISLSPMFKNIDLNTVLSKISLSTKLVVNLLFIIFLTLLTINIISVFFECGFKQCPDNPVRYININ